LLISSEVVRRIVTYAFLGKPPEHQDIVDHIVTNRQNNRLENLRWVTRLKKMPNNPITVGRIVFRCGSIEAFLKNPPILSRITGLVNMKGDKIIKVRPGQKHNHLTCF
jgi:hypothetical protein